MKKILLSVATLALVGVVSFGATRAFFSDTQVSEANAFTAGSVEIEISEIAHTYQGGVLLGDGADEPTYGEDGFSFNLADLKPLDWGEVTYTLSNDSNDAYVCAMVEEAGNAENGRVGPEVDAGDTTGGDPGNGNGELQDFMSFQIGGDTGLLSVIDGEWFDVGTGVLVNGGSASASIGYCFGEYVAGECEPNATGDVNVAQTDSMFADVSFQAVQTRNNEGFSCAQLNDGGETPIDDEVAATGPFDGWNGGGDLLWQTEGRFGNNGLSGDWELGVGNNTQLPGQFNQNQLTWVSGEAVPFVVDYDGTDVTFTIDGVSQTYTVGSITSTAELNIIAGKVSSGLGDSVELMDLEIDGNPIVPGTLVDTDNTDASYLVIDSLDLSGGFELTGTVEFNWTSATTAGSRPAFQVQVRD